METRTTFKRVKGPWPGVSESRRRVMQANKPQDTVPELVVRRMLHRMGYRFRLHRKDLPDRPDLAFPGRRAAIQIYGCFWHQHECRQARMPKSRQEYWAPKFARNVERDCNNERLMEEMGWRLLVLWECELADLVAIAQRVELFLGPPCASRSIGRAHQPDG
jgi:DNA mismatch endonuclease (patch repair protein)